MPKRKLFTVLWVTAGIILGLVLGWMVLRGVNWSSMHSALGRVSWDVLVPAVAAVIASLFLQAVRWKLMLPRESVSTTRLFFVRNAGLSLNNLSFAQGGGVLGDASELAMLTRSDKIDGSKVVASLFMSRILDFVITSIFVLVGFFIVPELSVFKPVIIPVLVVIALIVLFVLFATKVGRFPLLNRVRALQSSLRAVAFLRDRKLIFGLSISLTVLAWMLLGTAAWLVAQAIGIQLPFWMISILLVGMTLFSGAIPAAPSAIGTYEFVTVYILGLFSINKADALCFALLVHALVMIPPNLIGITTISKEWKTFRQITTQASALLKQRLFRRSACATQPVEDISVEADFVGFASLLQRD
jgi:glycosyltransferase 2 family protein